MLDGVVSTLQEESLDAGNAAWRCEDLLRGVRLGLPDSAVRAGLVDGEGRRLAQPGRVRRHGRAGERLSLDRSGPSKRWAVVGSDYRRVGLAGIHRRPCGAARSSWR